MKRLLGALVLSMVMLITSVSFAVEQTAVAAENGKEQIKTTASTTANKKKSYSKKSSKTSKKTKATTTDSGLAKTAQ